jgi:hypothetical protein
MLIIVADRGGLGGAAIRHALETKMKKWGVRIALALEWEQVKEYLTQDEDVIVLSAHVLRGFRTSAELASEVKRVKADAGFFVYNGAGKELSPHIDAYLPSTTGDTAIDSVIVPVMKDAVRNWSCRVVQQRLF